MLVRCSLCGGDNDVHPGQKMLFCSYCGSALAVTEKEGPEHLILPHTRNDRDAKEALTSFLLNKKRTSPKEMRVEFSYIPYLLREDDKGQMQTTPALKEQSKLDPLPYPPAGNYCFFDEKLAGNEKVQPVERIDEGTLRICHLPIYRISYQTGKLKRKATVVGENWQVLTPQLPPESPMTLNVSNALVAGIFFIIFLLIGKAMPTWPTRLFLLFAASTIGYTIFKVRTKVVREG